MTDFQRLQVLEEIREQRLETIAKSLGREKVDDPLVTLCVSTAKMVNQGDSFDVRWRFI